MTNVEVSRETLTWLVSVAEGTYVDQVGFRDRGREVEFRRHVSTAHKALSTVSSVVPEPKEESK